MYKKKKKKKFIKLVNFIKLVKELHNGNFDFEKYRSVTLPGLFFYPPLGCGRFGQYKAIRQNKNLVNPYDKRQQSAGIRDGNARRRYR